MTTDLSHTLHSTIDGERVGVPEAFDMTRVRSRARRRRVARTTARGAVGVGAAGAVVLGGVHVAGRGASVLPPASDGAPAGTCGSTTDALRDVPADDELALGVLAEDGAPTWFSPGGADEPQTKVVGPSLWLWPQFGDVGDLSLLPREPAPGTDAPRLVRVVVAHEGTVVGTSIQQVSTAEVPYSFLGWDPLDVPLTTCDLPDRAGGDPLPPGDYEVYAAPDDGPLTTAVGSVAGPWTVQVLERPVVSGLPADFPADVPLIPGRLVEARRLDDGGWFVEVASAGADRVSYAGSLLTGQAPESGAGLGARMFRTSLPDWDAEATISERYDVETLIYVLRPR